MDSDNGEKKSISKSFEQYANLLKHVMVDLYSNPYRPQERIVGKYKKEDLKEAIEAPELDANQKVLRRISRFAYNASQQYKRLIHFMAELPTLNYYIEPYDLDVRRVNVKKIEDAYHKTSKLLNTMNIKHEFSKILLSLFRDGVFYGYVHINSESFFIQQLDPDYCKIVAIEDGVHQFAFNFNYFFTYPERKDNFPIEFRTIFEEKYSNKKKNKSNPYLWEELSIDNAICIKFEESVSYPIPPFITLFGNILDIEDFKDLRKNKEELDIYKLLHMKIPTNDEENGFLVDEDFTEAFHNNVKEILPEQAGVATNPFDINVIDFQKDNLDKNRVVDATHEFWMDSGVSSLLFSSGTSQIGLTYSLKTDEAMVFPVLRQMERWVNRYLKLFGDSKAKFQIKILDQTIFNKDDFSSNQRESAAFGSFKLPWLASMGHSPSSITGLSFLENQVLKLHEKLVPLQSAHTQSSNDKGRPEKNVDDLGDTGLQQRDNLSNDNRAK